MRVVVIGDANVDLEIRLPDDASMATHQNPEPKLFGGGSAANTAAALARLGVPTRFVGSVGDDQYGRLATSSLAAAGVDVDSITTTSTEPTVILIAAVRPDGERLIYVWPARGGAHAALDVDHAVAAGASANWLHVSGLCLRVTPAREALLAAMKQARDNGIPVSFDLNLRLENWGWEEGFRGVVEEALTLADVVLGAAGDEMVPITGIDDPAAAAEKLAGKDGMVVARLGAAGAMLVNAGSAVLVPGYPVEVLDTLGAGDAFNAGFIAAMSRAAAPVEAVRLGNAVAALSVTRRGARATPTLAQAEALVAR